MTLFRRLTPAECQARLGGYANSELFPKRHHRRWLGLLILASLTALGLYNLVA